MKMKTLINHLLAVRNIIISGWFSNRAISIKVIFVFSLFCFVTPVNNPCLAKFRHGPIVDWKVSFTQGKEYLQSKEYEKAESCFREALKHVKRQPGSSLDDRAQCVQALALSLRKQDFVDEPLHLSKKACSILKKAHGEFSTPVEKALIDIGDIYEEEGDYKKAEKYYTKSFGIASKVSGVDTIDAANSQHLVGRSQFKQWLVMPAAKNYGQSLGVLMNQKELDSSLLLEDVMSDYIDLLLKTNANAKILKFNFDKELLKDNLNSLSQKKGHPQSKWSKQVSLTFFKPKQQSEFSRELEAEKKKQPTGLVATKVHQKLSGINEEASQIKIDRKLSDVLALKKINEQRILFYERMIELDIKSLGKDHPSVARDLSGLANVYISQRNYNEARPLLMRALKIYEKAYSQKSHLIKHTKLMLRLISEEENPDIAKPFQPYTKDLPSIPVRAQKIEVALRLNYLASLLLSQGKVTESKQIYFWALAATAKATGERSLFSAACMNDLARVLRLSGRATEARKFENNARAIWRSFIASKKAELLP